MVDPCSVCSVKERPQLVQEFLAMYCDIRTVYFLTLVIFVNMCDCQLESIELLALC